MCRASSAARSTGCASSSASRAGLQAHGNFRRSARRRPVVDNPSPPRALGGATRGRDMMFSYRRAGAIAACLAIAAIVAGCGSGSSDKGTKGGTLTLLTNADVDDKLDPGYSYYQLDFIYTNATQRAVLGFKPDDTTKPSPDLAASYPTISNGGKTITVKLRKGVKFSPPVNREATSADVKYALERDFLPQVGNGYAATYWADLVGLKAYQSGKAKNIAG